MNPEVLVLCMENAIYKLPCYNFILKLLAGGFLYIVNVSDIYLRERKKTNKVFIINDFFSCVWDYSVFTWE